MTIDVDVHETPAVPPEDSGGDERAGMIAAGGVLVTLGWVLGVVANVFVHLAAPSGGFVLGPVVVGHAFGGYAWMTLIIGALTGALGVAVAWSGRASAAGPLVLPGGSY